MTRETKLGLIIGGAFILCFAFILSSTENEAALDRQIAAIMPPPLDQADPDAQMASGHLPRQLVGYTLPNVQPALPIETRSQQPGAGPAQAAPIGAGTEVENHIPAEQEVITEPLEVSVADARQSLPTANPSSPIEVTDAIANRPLPQPNSRGGENPNTVADRAERQPAHHPIDIIPPPRTPTMQPKPRPRPIARRVQVYVVAQNDNLTKIARKFYGKPKTAKQVAENVELIFQANRETLKDRNSVHAGQKLRIPLPEDPNGRAGTQSSSLAKSQAHTPTPQATFAGISKSADKNWRWYQIKPKDRYARIAKEQLGDAKRWKDIFELNKDIFPNPDKIRPGVRIRLPG